MNSYLLEVVATNRFFGQHVILNTTEEMTAMGLRSGSVRSSSCISKSILKGFRITIVPRTTASLPGQQAIIEYFINNPVMFNLRHHPVIGEVQEGLYAGEKIALFTQQEIKSYFSLGTIRQVAKKEGVHLHTRWRYAKDYQEAEPFYHHPEKQQILDVLRDSYVYDKTPLTEHDQRVFSLQVTEVAQALSVWQEHHPQKSAPSALTALVKIYQQLTNTIRCEAHYHWLLDTLYHLRAMVMYRSVPTDKKIVLLTGSLLSAAQHYLKLPITNEESFCE